MKFPVLHVPARSPKVDAGDVDAGGRRRGRGAATRFDWDELPRAGAGRRRSRDLHCVTRWSQFDTRWDGRPRARRSLDRARPRDDATHVLAHGYDGYTTNLPLAALLADDVADRRPRSTARRWSAEHGCPRAAARPVALPVEVGEVAVARSSSSTTTSRASGSATATTTTATPGASSAPTRTRSRSGRCGAGRAAWKNPER